VIAENNGLQSRTRRRSLHRSTIDRDLIGGTGAHAKLGWLAVDRYAPGTDPIFDLAP